VSEWDITSADADIIQGINKLTDKGMNVGTRAIVCKIDDG
jgi:hypothetical protein